MALPLQTPAGVHQDYRIGDGGHGSQDLGLAVIALQRTPIAGDRYGGIAAGMTVEPKDPR
jgi:hypothetical protein